MPNLTGHACTSNRIQVQVVLDLLSELSPEYVLLNEIFVK